MHFWRLWRRWKSCLKLHLRMRLSKLLETIMQLKFRWRRRNPLEEVILTLTQLSLGLIRALTVKSTLCARTWAVLHLNSSVFKWFLTGMKSLTELLFLIKKCARLALATKHTPRPRTWSRFSTSRALWMWWCESTSFLKHIWLSIQFSPY